MKKISNALTEREDYMLTEKAKQDLLNLHNEVLASGDIEKFDLFWNTLIFAGCDEEFESFKDNLKEQEQNNKIADHFAAIFKNGQYEIIEAKPVYQNGFVQWVLYIKSKNNAHYTVTIHSGCDIRVLQKHGIPVVPF